MYQIKNYADCTAVHNLDTEKSRPLTADELAKIKTEFPTLGDPKTVSIFTDTITAIDPKLLP